MKLTKTYVYPNKSDNKVVLGNGSVIFDDVFFVKFTIMSGKSGPFVNWPSQKGKDDKWYPYCGFTIDKEAETPYEFKNEIEKEIISQFNKELAITPKDNTETVTKVEEPIQKAQVTATKPKLRLNIGKGA
jgi:DNA-binding cell septation regulator SpoVG